MRDSFLGNFRKLERDRTTSNLTLNARMAIHKAAKSVDFIC
ncbi:hypothetical protein I600_1791 [Maribacter dokdonensis DSW-8]|nr:hypothetical protein I600_1791 [Maribacter dokdonensis DSW-8]